MKRMLAVASSAVTLAGITASPAAAETWPFDVSETVNQFGDMHAEVEVSSSQNPRNWYFSIDNYSLSRYAVQACQIRVTVKYDGDAPLRRVFACDPGASGSTQRTWPLARPPKGTYVEATTRIDGTVNGYRYSSLTARIDHTTAQ